MKDTMLGGYFLPKGTQVFVASNHIKPLHLGQVKFVNCNQILGHFADQKCQQGFTYLRVIISEKRICVKMKNGHTLLHIHIDHSSYFDC